MKLRSKKDGTIINVPSELEDQVRAIIEAGGDPTELLQDNQMAKGGMIKRADGSYSRRGLWDNIRAKAAANKKAGKKGKKPTKAMLEQEAEIRAAEKAYGGYMQMGGGLTDWLMASGGCMECGGMMESGGKMPQWLAEARFPDKSKLEEYGYKPVDQAGDGKWIQKATKSIKKRGTEGVCTGSKFGGPSCPPGSKRYNLAKTFRKMAKSRKDDGGYLPIAENSILPQLLAPALQNTMVNPEEPLPGDYSLYEQPSMYLPEDQYDAFDLNNAPRIIPIAAKNKSVQKFDPNKTTSIVDYLASVGMKSDKESRKALAKRLGIKDYDFSASKNLELLNKLRNAKGSPERPIYRGANPSVPTPVSVSSPAPPPISNVTFDYGFPRIIPVYQGTSGVRNVTNSPTRDFMANGGYVEGQQYEMSDAEIARLRAMGYKIREV